MQPIGGDVEAGKAESKALAAGAPGAVGLRERADAGDGNATLQLTQLLARLGDMEVHSPDASQLNADPVGSGDAADDMVKLFR